MASRFTIVGLGEILWDVFPDGAHFGGAPANFACCVKALCGDAVDVAIASSVGDDELGRRAMELLCTRGVDTTYVSKVDRPTGQVLVAIDAVGQASYQFADDAAWDNIAWSDELRQLASNSDAVCFGTLGQRSEVSRQTIQAFLRATRPDCLRILDVNFRNPFWTEEILLQSLELANVVKLNDSELGILADLLGWKGGVDLLLDQLLDKYSLQVVALTRGADGAVLIGTSGEGSKLPGREVAIVDTVGAGDSYTAALAVGLLKGLPLATINAWASRVAEFVCSQSGATPQLPIELRRPEHSP